MFTLMVTIHVILGGSPPVASLCLLAVIFVTVIRYQHGLMFAKSSFVVPQVQLLLESPPPVLAQTFSKTPDPVCPNTKTRQVPSTCAFNRGAHDVLRGIRPCSGCFAVGSGTTHRGNHGAIQGALRAGWAGLTLNPWNSRRGWHRWCVSSTWQVGL